MAPTPKETVAAARANGGLPVDGGLISRIATGVRFAFSGKSVDEFFGPGQPLQPVAQDQAHGRAFDYDFSINTSTRPRSTERIDFPTLRALADAYDIIRLAIETRKDQMGKLRWTVTRRDDGTQDAKAKEIEDFLQSPDQENDYLDWSRMIMEDLLVIDAPAVYIRKTYGGAPFAFEQIDGATIKRNLDARGRTPLPPDPAYQQIIKGMPATNYTSDELVYKPRNPRINRVYGFSPVEQLVLIVNIGLRREAHQLAFYTAGNIPDMIMAAPKEWSPDQIKQFQKLWDQLLAGDSSARRSVRFVPGDVKPFALRPESSLFDAFDEWIARIVCYCFNLAPTAFVKQVNRATAESAQQVAEEEGLAPFMEWNARFMNRVIQKGFNTTDYQFTYVEETSVDLLEQAQVDQIYVQSGIRLPNEIREDHDWEQRPELDERKLNPPMPPSIGAPDANGNPPKPGDARATGAKNPQDTKDAKDEAAKLSKRRALRRPAKIGKAHPY